MSTEVFIKTFIINYLNIIFVLCIMITAINFILEHYKKV